jgi:hypothetical protein
MNVLKIILGEDGNGNIRPEGLAEIEKYYLRRSAVSRYVEVKIYGYFYVMLEAEMAKRRITKIQKALNGEAQEV